MIRYRGIEIDRKCQVIRHRGACYRFRFNGSPCRRFTLLTALILAGGLTPAQMFERVYGGDEDGGPLSGAPIFFAMLNRMQPLLAGLHLELRSARRGGRWVYWLESIGEHHDGQAEVCVRRIDRRVPAEPAAKADRAAIARSRSLPEMLESRA